VVSTRKLTERQTRFVEAYRISGNATDAARKAGYSDPNKGRQLVAKGNVAAALQVQVEQRRERAIASLNERHKFLSTVQRNKKADLGHRIRACELLMRANGEFASVAIVTPPGGGSAVVSGGDNDDAPNVTFYMPANGRDQDR
jgi:phage terminase small subunit